MGGFELILPPIYTEPTQFPARPRASKRDGSPLSER